MQRALRVRSTNETLTNVFKVLTELGPHPWIRVTESPIRLRRQFVASGLQVESVICHRRARETCSFSYRRAVWKVRGLTLFRVETLWRCGDGLFFEVPPLASDALLTTLHPLLENVLQTVDYFEISCLGAPFLWLKKPRNRMGRDMNWILCSAWKTWIGGTPLEHPQYSPDLAPCDFWAFPTMKRELRGKKFRSDERSAARFREVGGAL
jgi:hypothetical protein